jgi:hypothetical protein
MAALLIEAPYAGSHRLLLPLPLRSGKRHQNLMPLLLLLPGQVLQIPGSH